jgi:sigma-B regulation protein RsbU (phosphoserine phosphatase)
MASMNTILYERQLEEYYCTLLYGIFDFKRRTLTMANAGLPYPIRKRGGHAPKPAAQIELPGVPLGSFSGSNYDEVVLDLKIGDLFVFFTDGITEAMDPLMREFGVERLLQIVDAEHQRPAREIVDMIFTAVQEFRGDTPPNDDMTAVVMKITG